MASSPEIPMPSPTSPPLPLKSYKLLSFDVYGTLICYKSHILTAFKPLIGRLPSSSHYRDPTPLSSTIPASASKGDVEFLKLFQKTEDAIKLELASNPMRFDAVLREIYRRVAKALELQVDEAEVENFGSVETIKSWPVFDGTVESLTKLSEMGYGLVALSNVDSFATEITFPATGLSKIPWMTVFTAEAFGTSAEDLRNADRRKFEALLKFAIEKRVRRKEMLHVAQSLGHDHKPAKDMGVSSVFLVGDGPVWGKEEESRMAVEKGLVGYAWRCRDLKEFVEVVETDRNV